MPTPDENETGAAPAAQATPPTPPTEGDETESRGRGRPSLAELKEREDRLKAREAEIAEREAEIELAAAEANLAMREAELMRREQQVVAAGRAPARSGSVRSEDITQPVRGRRYKGAEMPDKFHIPTEDIPEGISYQWNNHTIFGQEQRHYSAFMEMQGWVPVPASRHPHLMPKNANPSDPIIIDGQILMERPQELTDVRAKEEQLYGTPQGTLPRARENGSNDFIAVRKGVEPGTPVPRNYQYETAQGGVIE
jgi:hypothetical protein